MKEADVAIIGAGVSGLVCAYELQKKGVNSLVLEKESYAGGRIRNVTVEGVSVPVGAMTFTPDYSVLLQILDDLKLTRAVTSLPLSKSGLLIQGEPLALDRWSILKSRRLPFHVKFEITRLFKRLHDLEPWSIDGNLMDVSLLDYLKGLVSQETIGLIIEPALNAFFQQPSNLAASIGLQILKGLPKIRYLNGGLASLVDALVHELKLSVRLNMEVTDTVLRDGVWSLNVKPSLDSFRFLVSAIPLDEAGRLFPEARIPDLRYASANALIVKGKYRFGSYELLLDEDWRNSGIHSIRSYGTLQVIHARTPSPDLASFYEDYEILHSVEWHRTLPLIPPGTRLPSILTSLPNLFLAGDFLLGGRVESAVRSARMVAEAIRKRIGE